MTDVLQHTFYCARSGEPFLVEFSRARKDFQFTITRISKIPEESGGGRGAATRTSKINPKNVSFSGFQCPYCNTAHESAFVHCGKCGTDVCMGATSRDIWRCTPACGQSTALSGLGLIKSHTFAKIEQAYQHLKPIPALRPQRLKQAITPTLDGLFSRQKSSGRELVKIETPKSQSRSISIRRKGQ